MAIRMLGCLDTLHPSVEYEVDPDIATVEPFHVDDFFIGDRLRHLVCFTKADKHSNCKQFHD